jgi:hypothetical protein
MGMIELAALPWLIALSLLAVGGMLALAPRRIVRTLGDGFGFDGEAATRTWRGQLPARVLGLVLSGYSCFMMANILHLFRALHG